MIKTKTRNLTSQQRQEVPDAVRYFQYGCINCLWSGAECTSGSRYKYQDAEKSNGTFIEAGGKTPSFRWEMRAVDLLKFS